jgi:hypothetical protein
MIYEQVWKCRHEVKFLSRSLVVLIMLFG